MKSQSSQILLPPSFWQTWQGGIHLVSMVSWLK
jgi:hypothetical protein